MERRKRRFEMPAAAEALKPVLPASQSSLTGSDKMFVRYDEGAERYSMGKTSFIAMATEARAIYKRGKLCLVNVKIFEEYLETFRV